MQFILQGTKTHASSKNYMHMQNRVFQKGEGRGGGAKNTKILNKNSNHFNWHEIKLVQSSTQISANFNNNRLIFKKLKDQKKTPNLLDLSKKSNLSMS